MGTDSYPWLQSLGRLNPSWTSKKPGVHCLFVTLWDLHQATPTASSFLGLRVSGFDT